jgi:hypothetical protein
MGKLGWMATALVTAIVATVGIVVFVSGDSAEATPPCGVWTRTSSTNASSDGMQIRIPGDTAIVVDPAGSRFEFGATLWRNIAETDDGATLEVLGTDGNYYPATFEQHDDTRLDLTVGVAASGALQTWTTTSDLGCVDLALADVACGTWTRISSNSPNSDGMQVRIAGDRSIVTDPSSSRFAVGDELWRNIAPDGDQATVDVLGSDGIYYSATITGLTGDSLRIDVDVAASGNEQTWTRSGDAGCGTAPLSDVACGLWSRLTSSNSSLDGIEVRIAGGSAIVTDPANSWLEEGAVVWQNITEGTGEFTLDVRGSDGIYYGATLVALDADTLELTVNVSASGNQQTWVRVNDVGCDTPAELACGVWERSASSNPNNDGMRIRVEGSTARVTDQANSPFAVGKVLWRNIVSTDTGLGLEVLGTDNNYYPGVLTATGVDVLALTIDAAGAGTSQSWVEVDASGCVFSPGIADIVCGTWSRTSSSNPGFDGMSIAVIGDQARVVDPAASRFPIGEVLWRYIAAGPDLTTLEVRGTDGNYYSADATSTGVGEIAIEVGAAGSGSSQTWFQTDSSDCSAGAGVLCGSWERTSSSNANFDGMQIVGSGASALLTEPSGSPFAVGEVVWRDVTSTPPTVTLEVLGSDFSYYDGELTSAGVDALRLDISAAGSGTEQTWTELDSTGCVQSATSDIVCGTWTRTSSNNSRLDGMMLRVSDGRGTVTFTAGDNPFAVGDILWRNVVPELRGFSLEVRGTDANYYPAGLSLVGADTAELSIDASGAGTAQTWNLTEPGSCDVPDLSICGTWTRTASTNASLDGTTIRVENGTATVETVPTGTSTFAVGDVVWRSITPFSGGYTIEVLGGDGIYYSATLTSTGVDSLTVRIDASGAGTEQTWVETGTDGCDRPPVDGADTDSVPGTTTTTIAPDDGDGAARPTTPTSAPTPTTAAPTTSPELTAGDCIPGTWLLDSATFIESIVDTVGAGADFAYESGTYNIVVAADGTYTSNRVDWTLRASSPQGSILIVFNGVQTGVVTWDDVIVSADEQTNTTAVQMYADIGGGLQAIPGGTTINTETLDAAAPYECVGDTLSINANGANSVWHRQ